ncbi:MAG: hypothetical protein Ta2F_01800 [Termitinemataceae bacterium]|nr:MAG: hypothetical protein Ta2F_01800 [Termitinemataceae bacterium]
MMQIAQTNKEAFLEKIKLGRIDARLGKPNFVETILKKALHHILDILSHHL